MTTTLRSVGGYVAGLSLAALAALLLGFGTLHLAFAVPQAVLPVAAGVLTLGAGLVTLPVVRRSLRRRTGLAVEPSTVRRADLLAVTAAVVLSALYVAVSLA